jgi:hypothetical protein
VGVAKKLKESLHCGCINTAIIINFRIEMSVQYMFMDMLFGMIQPVLPWFANAFLSIIKSMG